MSYTKLQALNAIAERIGALPIAALDTGGNSKAAKMERLFDVTDKQLQLRGWYFNTELDVEIAPDGSSNVNLPANTLKIDVRSNTAEFTVRDGLIYDLENNTNEITDTYSYDYVTQVAFDECPDIYQEYVIAKVAHDYYNRHTDRREKDRFLMLDLQQSLLEAKVRLEQSDTSQADYNVLDTRDAFSVRGSRYIDNSGFSGYIPPSTGA